MKTIEEIIETIRKNEEVKNEIENIIDIMVQKYNREIEKIDDIEDDIKRGEILSQPLFSLDREFFYLKIAIERNIGINIERYIKSDDFKNDKLYKDNIKTVAQFTAYICFFLSDDNMFSHLKYECCQVNYYF